MTNQLKGEPNAGTTFDVISRHQKVQRFHSIAYISPTVQRESAFYFGSIMTADRYS
jgi:hypothetical protein